MNFPPQRISPEKLKFTFTWAITAIFLVLIYIIWCVWARSINGDDTFWSTFPVLAFSFIISVVLAIFHRLNLETLGWHVNQWKRDLSLSLWVSLFIIFLAIAFKYSSQYGTDKPLFNFWFHLDAGNFWIIPAYALMVPMQVFIFRSCLQNIWVSSVNSKSGKAIAIVCSSLIYSSGHLHISLEIVFATIIPGLLWGWLFYLSNSVLAPIISQITTGLFVFYIVGFHDFT